MKRKLARIATLDSLAPIPGADFIELARVGGWKTVVKKGEFKVGDRVVYFEIDAFLPSGTPAWEFLVDKSPTEHEGAIGHVLRTVRLQKQLSQGLVLPPSAFKASVQERLQQLPLGEDVASLLDVTKYEKPLPKELLEVAIGYYPSQVPTTDQERVQNLTEELAAWVAASGEGCLTWEVSEKLEGESCSFLWLLDGLHVCSRNVDFKELDHVHLWRMAHQLRIREKLQALFGDREVGLQGEIVGPGIEGNHYGLKEPAFFLYNIYDVKDGRYWSPAARRIAAMDLHLNHVPVLNKAFVFKPGTTAQTLLDMADGASALASTKRREGLVFKCNEKDDSFKAVSDLYLLGVKLSATAKPAPAAA